MTRHYKTPYPPRHQGFRSHQNLQKDTIIRFHSTSALFNKRLLTQFYNNKEVSRNESAHSVEHIVLHKTSRQIKRD